MSVLNESHYAPLGSNTRINCSVTGEAFNGWFDSKRQKISNNPSQRLHVKNEGSLQYLEILRVNKTDQGSYECRGETTKATVVLYVECKYIGRDQRDKRVEGSFPLDDLSYNLCFCSEFHFTILEFQFRA